MTRCLFRRVLQYLCALMFLLGVGFYSILFSPFGIPDRLDYYSQDLFNQILGDFPFVFPAVGQQHVSVLLLTDETVDGSYSGVWPIPYDAHGRILNNLLRHQPRAVVIDFLWLNQHKPGSGHLKRVLERYRRANIPVYLSFRNPQGLHTLWPELRDLVIPVSPKVATDPSDFVARRYLFESNGLPSPAMAVYRDLYNDEFKADPEQDLQIFWGVRPNTQNEVWMDRGDPEMSSLELLTEGFDKVRYSPPYTTTVLVRDLLRPVDKDDDAAFTDLSNHLKGRVVFYGGKIDGVGDLIYTPARQIRPGVYYHAMALDNLISFQGAYKSKDLKATVRKQWRINDYGLYFLILLVPSLFLVMRHHLRRDGTNWYEELFKLCGISLSLDVPDNPTWKSRFLQRPLIVLLRWMLSRLPLYVWIVLVMLCCYFVLELAPSNWIGYLAFAELGFYLDNLLFFQNSSNYLKGGLRA